MVSSTNKTINTLAIVALLLAPAAFLFLPAVPKAFAEGQPRAPNVIATTLAFDNGQVVTVQYSNIYFCNSAGPATNATASPCAIGIDATKGPVPDTAANVLNVIVPAFLHPLCDILKISCLSSDPSQSVFNPALGANNFAQCPDNTSTLTCPNHPNFLDLTPTGIAGVVPLPIHSHVISGQGVTNAQGGWWELKVWLVLDPSVWPNPSTGSCSAGTSCLTSDTALANAGSAVVGPVLSTIYLHFNVVSSNAK